MQLRSVTLVVASMLLALAVAACSGDDDATSTATATLEDSEPNPTVDAITPTAAPEAGATSEASATPADDVEPRHRQHRANPRCLGFEC